MVTVPGDGTIVTNVKNVNAIQHPFKLFCNSSKISVNLIFCEGGGVKMHFLIRVPFMLGFVKHG